MATPDTLGIGPQPLTGITGTASSFYGAGWEASKAFDGTVSAAWSAAGGSSAPAWLQAQLASTQVVSHYRIYARTDVPATTPSAWTFEGSNDAVSWTVLDTQSGQTWQGGVYHDYTCSNSTSYLYYRLNISAVMGGGVPAVAEFILYSTTTTATTLLDWWKTDAITGVADGATLNATSIVDSSGNGHTFSNNIRAGVYRATTGPNSMPFIDGSTTSGFAYSGAAKPAPTDDFTAFAVVKTSSTAIQSIIGSVNNGGAELRINNYKVEILQDGVLSLGTSVNSIPSGSWVILIATYTQSTGVITVNIHGGSESIAASANKAFTSPGSTLSFGAYQGGASSIWQGGIAEVGRYKSVLSSADQTSLYNYLQTKYFPNPSNAQVEATYSEALITGSASAQVEGTYAEALITGASNSQVEAAYTEALVTGSAKAQIETDYVEALVQVQPAQVETVYAETLLTGTPAIQVESLYTESLLTTTPPINVEATYIEVLLIPLPGVNFSGWGVPI